jgi:hypothetical protein
MDWDRERVYAETVAATASLVELADQFSRCAPQEVFEGLFKFFESRRTPSSQKALAGILLWAVKPRADFDLVERLRPCLKSWQPIVSEVSRYLARRAGRRALREAIDTLQRDDSLTYQQQRRLDEFEQDVFPGVPLRHLRSPFTSSSEWHSGWSDYDDERARNRFVFHHYGHLLTESERRADRRFLLRGKADGYGDGDIERIDSYFDPSVLGDRTDDHVVEGYLRMGYEKFVHQAGERILHEHGDAVVLNRCPQCSRIAATPQSRYCSSCKHSWA